MRINTFPKQSGWRS